MIKQYIISFTKTITIEEILISKDKYCEFSYCHSGQPVFGYTRVAFQGHLSFTLGGVFFKRGKVEPRDITIEDKFGQIHKLKITGGDRYQIILEYIGIDIKNKN